MLHPFAPDRSRVQAQVRLLATTDLHFQLRGHDEVADRPVPDQGLLAVARLIRALRPLAPTSLLFDIGDMLQGSVLADILANVLAADLRADRPNPMIAAMNRVGYDAATLGNHDFDHGLAYLDGALAQAQFPLVATNLDRIDGGHWLPRHLLIRTRAQAGDGTWWPLCIGVIGFAPPQTVLWDRHHLAGHITARDIVPAAQAQLPALRAAGAEIVVALCHSGIGAADAVPGMEHAAVPLAALPGIDVVLAGHAHDVFPGPWPMSEPVTYPASAPESDSESDPVSNPVSNPVIDPIRGRLHGKPAVMAGFHGTHLGLVDLLIERGPAGWQVVNHASRALPLSGSLGAGRREPAPSRQGRDKPAPDRPDRDDPVLTRPDRDDPVLTRIARNVHRRVRGYLARPLGATAVPLHSHFALVGPDAALTLVAQAQRAAARALLADRPEGALPLLSAVSPFRAGGPGGAGHYLDIPPGPLTLRDAAGLYAYPNALTVLELDGAGVADWLEDAASVFARIVPGLRDQPLLNPGFPAYLFDVLDGLTWQIDPAAPPRRDAAGQVVNPGTRRVGDIRLDGVPLDPRDRVLVVTNSHRAGGGGGFAAVQQAQVVADGSLTNRAALEQFIRAHSPVHPEARPTWRFAPLPGTAAWFDSGTSALAHLPLAGRKIADAGVTAQGFRRFVLTF